MAPRITGIIAEYNPFHKGHAYHLSKAKALTGADYVIAVISGDFVQRGEPALADKYCRAHMALAEGADLVLELPSPYACASAETFAAGAVSLLEHLGCVNALCFGSECGDLLPLDACARVLAEEPASYQELLRTFLRQGYSFPLSRSKALLTYLAENPGFSPLLDQENPQASGNASASKYGSVPGIGSLTKIGELLNQPNNLLGMEYLKALRLQNSPIRPYTIARKGASYHDTALSGSLSSASAIRKALHSGGFSLVSQQLPPGAGRILKSYLSKKKALTWDDFSPVLHYRLLSMTQEELSACTDVSPELAARIRQSLVQFQSASSFASLLKTRQVTHTRVTRALCHILLNDRKEDASRRKETGYPVYARILGFCRKSQSLLSIVKQSSRIPVISRPAQGMKTLAAQASWDSCPFSSEELTKLFQQDLFASHIYESMVTNCCHTSFCHEYTRKMLIV
ncbi:MAG: nucleotidyltransferase [Lachnospiraceae bacterium]|jgi:predicted nucleotidyltransferase|nr:nucleotidyltransferase [Lachnospiraceae bacterium]